MMFSRGPSRIGLKLWSRCYRPGYWDGIRACLASVLGFCLAQYYCSACWEIPAWQTHIRSSSPQNVPRLVTQFEFRSFLSGLENRATLLHSEDGSSGLERWMFLWNTDCLKRVRTCGAEFLDFSKLRFVHKVSWLVMPTNTWRSSTSHKDYLFILCFLLFCLQWLHIKTVLFCEQIKGTLFVKSQLTLPHVLIHRPALR